MAKKAAITHVERLRKAKIIHPTLKLPRRVEKRINRLTKPEVDALIRIGRKVGPVRPRPARPYIVF